MGAGLTPVSIALDAVEKKFLALLREYLALCNHYEWLAMNAEDEDEKRVLLGKAEAYEDAWRKLDELLNGKEG